MTNLASTIDVPQPSYGPSTEHPPELASWARRISEAAEATATAAEGAGAAEAIASALAHMETALEHLERGTEAMEGLARARLTQATELLGDPWNHAVLAHVAHDFEDLERALGSARRTCEKLRRNAGPILAELTAV